MSTASWNRAIEQTMTSREREEHRQRVRAAEQASRDFPILPTSPTDPTLSLPPEADDKLTPAQRIAVAALVGGQTFCAAAREAKVSRRTLYAWRQEPAFQQAVDQTSRQAMSAALVRVRNLMLRATRVLGDAMLEDSRKADHAFRVLNSRHLWATANQSEAPSTADVEAVAEPSASSETIGGNTSK